MWVFDPDSLAFIDVNKAGLAKYGYSRDEFLAMTIRDIYADGQMDRLIEKLAEINPNGIRSAECQHRLKSGETITVMVDSHKFEFDGQSMMVSVIRDNAAGSNAEKRFKRDQQILRLFVENNPAAIAMFDRDMRYIVTSRRYLWDYHIPKQELAGRCHYDVFPEIPQRWKEIHKRCLAGSVEKCSEDPFPREDGSLDWVRWEIHPWYEEAGQIGGIILFSEVITDQKRKEQAHELSRSHLVGLIDSAMDGIISLDENQRVILFNPASEKIFGVNAKDMMGQPVEILLPERFRAKHPARVASFGKSEEANSSREMTGTRIVTGVRANGEEFPMEASISRIEVGGKKVYTVIHRDITNRLKARLELQESEERFRRLYEFAPVGISNLTPEGKFIRCNPALEKITGYSEDELQGMSVYDITHPGDRGSSEELRLKLIEGKVKTNSIEKRYVRKDGSIVWVQLISTGVSDDKGNYQYTVSITQDITEQKNSHEKIKRLNRVYAVLSDINQTIVHVKDTSSLFEEACRIAVEVGDFKLAWVGAFDEKSGDIEPVAYSGDKDAYLDLLKISKRSETPTWVSPVGIALREKHPIVKNNLTNDEPGMPWHTGLSGRGFGSFAVFPLTSGDKVYGAICYYSSETGFFDEQEVALLEELSSDISFSIENIERESERRTLEKDRDRMFNYSLDMLSIVGFDMSFKQINPAWSRILGWTTEELMAKTFIDFIHPHDRENSIKAMAALIDGTAGHGIENRVQCKDGSYRWLSWNCVPLVEEKMIFAVTRDITDQKKSREQLLIRNAAIQSSASAIGLADMKGKMFYVNSSFVKLWGYDDFNEVIGKDIFEFSIPAGKIRNAISIMKTGRSFVGEGKAKKKDGTPIDYHVTANIVISEDNEPICMMSSFMDITERKMAEEKLRNAYDELKQSEGKYRSLFEQAKEAILISNPDGSLVDVNPAAVELFGYDSKEDFLRNNIAELYIDSTDREMLFDVLWRERYIKDREIMLRKKNGERIMVSSTAALMLDESRQNVSVLAVLRDVTMQKSLEAQLIQAQKLESLGTLAGGIAHDFNNILGSSWVTRR